MLQLYCCPFVRHDSVVRTCVAAARAYAATPSWRVTTATQAHSASSTHWTCVVAARAYAAMPWLHVTTATQAHSASSPHWTCVAAARAYAASATATINDCPSASTPSDPPTQAQQPRTGCDVIAVTSGRQSPRRFFHRVAITTFEKRRNCSFAPKRLSTHVSYT